MNLGRTNKYFGGLLIAFFLLSALLGWLWTPYDPLALDLRARLQAPSAAHWLGTDEYGRDVLSRLMAAARTSVTISALTVSFAVTFGIVLGALSGYARGWIDRAVMLLTDTLLAFPSILLALALLSILGANIWGVILGPRAGLHAHRDPRGARRGHVPAGAGVHRGLAPDGPSCRLYPAGPRDPQLPGAGDRHRDVDVRLGPADGKRAVLPWPGRAAAGAHLGNMLAGARPYMSQASWLGIFPGLCIALTLLGINLFGDYVRDRFDPRMKGL
ncbi:ABC transporter permease [Ponticoccus litoralis]|uniref:ABC transporter permease n=1 Tax=Ponticoccus litoralis TaxID=422297 RepID=UPI003D2F3B0B